MPLWWMDPLCTTNNSINERPCMVKTHKKRFIIIIITDVGMVKGRHATSTR